MTGATQTRLRIADVLRDPAVQVRHKIDLATVERYALDWALLPPVLVFRLPDGRLLLVDGWHRLAAADRLELTEVAAILREDTYTAACDEAARANMASGRQLTKEERHEAIARTYERHKPIRHEELAGLLGISRRTVGRVLTVEDVKQDVGPLASAPDRGNITAPLVADGRRSGRPKQAIKDDHYVELAAAPADERKPLAEATAQRGWTPRETREAVREIADPATPPERKDHLRAGRADPLVMTETGEPAVLPETLARAMTEPVAGEAYRLYKDTAVLLARLAMIPAAEIIAGVNVTDLAALANDSARIPRYISVLEAIQAAARTALRPQLQEAK